MSSVSLQEIMPNYPNWDQNVAVIAAQSTTNVLGGRDSSGKLIKSDADIVKKIDVESVAGHTNDQLANIENLFKQKINEYLDDTENIILLNDLANVNTFANSTVDKELQRLTDLRTRTGSDLIKSKTNHLSKRYTIDYNTFIISMVQFSFAMLLLLALVIYAFRIRNMFSLKVFYVLTGILVSIYAVALVLMIKDIQYRRKDDWQKFYFFKKTT